MPRVDLNEGGYFPAEYWYAWGEIKAWRNTAPRREYKVWTFPAYQFKRVYGFFADADIHCWHKIALVWTHTEGDLYSPYDGYRFMWLPEREKDGAYKDQVVRSDFSHYNDNWRSPGS